MKNAVTRTLTTGEAYNLKLELTHADGSTRWTNVFGGVKRDQNGKIIGIHGIEQDITERKELEKEREYHEMELMKFSTSLEAANKKLNLLSSITRHDINNQLTVLMGYLSILENRQPDPTLDEYLLKALTAAQRISSMIRFAGEYEKIGINSPVWQDCHILVDSAANQAHPGQVIVNNNLPPGMEIFADQLVVKVWYNLMENAIRYGGQVTTIRFSSMVSGNDQIIMCEDNGSGIPADMKEKIFDRGFSKNTGLGLAISREIPDNTGITIRETGGPQIRRPVLRWLCRRGRGGFGCCDAAGILHAENERE